ncbi:MAG: hypothetical protein ABSB01_22945 [Streptosporangiaceae bacterium]|jgi:hypothetical protein
MEFMRWPASCQRLIGPKDLGSWRLTGWIMGAVVSYLLVPESLGTRLLLKVVMAHGRLVAPLLSAGDLIMARRQLLNMARLAEQAAAH